MIAIITVLELCYSSQSESSYIVMDTGYREQLNKHAFAVCVGGSVLFSGWGVVASIS
jgi:hypothetical protein